MGIRKPVLSVQEARRLSSIRPITAHSELPAAEVLAPIEQPTQDERAAVIQPSPPARPNVYATRQSEAVIAPKTDVQPSQLAPSNPPINASPRARSTHSAEQMQSIARIQVFVSANVPLPDVSRFFELLSRQYPPEKALQMILRRAMDDYEESLASGTFGKLPESYPCDSKIMVYTSRMMSRDLLAVARNHFDPLGFESERAFGYKLANAALASFFATEAKLRAS